MTIRKQYLFDDFTLSNYRRLLKIAQSRFQFIGYNELSNWDSFLLWRHDLEFSPSIALKMANAENELGIKTSYFINLHSNFYNPLDSDVFKDIMCIQELGHDIGLHFDCHFYSIENENELVVRLIKEKEIMEYYFGIKIHSFSFHNTTPEILKYDKTNYGGLLNVYSNDLRTNVDYCADSTGFWRFERLEERLQDKTVKKLQVLIHDGMWSEEVLPPRQRIHKVIDQSANKLKVFYDEILHDFSAANIDWNGPV